MECTQLLPSIYSEDDDQLFMPKIQKYLNEKEKILEKAYSSSSSSSGSFLTSMPPSIRIGNDYHGLSIHTDNSRTVHNAYPNQKKDNSVLRVLIGIVSTVVLGIGAFFVGHSYGKMQDSAEKLKKLEEIKEILKDSKTIVWKKCAFDLKDNKHFKAISKIVKADLKLNEDIHWNTRANFISTIVIAAGAALALLGVLFTSSITMLSVAAFGTAAVIGTTAFLLMKWGYRLGNHKEEKLTEIMNQNLNKLPRLDDDYNNIKVRY